MLVTLPLKRILNHGLDTILLEDDNAQNLAIGTANGVHHVLEITKTIHAVGDYRDMVL